MMKFIKALCALLAVALVACNEPNYGTETSTTIASLGTPEDNEIWFNTTDGKVLLSLDEDAFNTPIAEILYDEAGMNIIRFEGTLTTIGEEAFSYCHNIFNLSLPNSVKEIGERAFAGCGSLTSIVIPDGVTTIAKDAFSGSDIKQVTVSAVAGDTSCVEEVLGRDKIVGYVGEYASADGRCIVKDGMLLDFIYKEETWYSIPRGVKTICKKALRECDKLSSVTIPDSITEIENEAFTDCCNLTAIKCLATTPPTIYDLNIYDLTLIYVPKEAVKAYNLDSNWSKYYKQIKPIK